jgi:primosomal protein N' (replication factor Y)
VVTPRPLKLKAQIGAYSKKSVAEVLPVARVWVDTGVFHLDTPFEYWVPSVLSLDVTVGTRVQVEFGSSLQEGIVIERSESSPSMGNLKQILKVLSPSPVATPQTLKLFRLVAKRWAGSPYDVIRSAIPPRVASVDKESLIDHAKLGPALALPSGHSKALMQKKVRAYWSLPPCIPRQRLIAELVVTRSKLGQVLVIVPDERELRAIEEELLTYFSAQSVVRLDGSLTRSDRYRNFLRVTRGQADIILGLRGAVFAPLSDGATIIVAGESAQSLHEPRAPGWNARDVALIRSSEMEANLIFVGYSPSLELARLIDTKWLSLISSKTRRVVVAVSPSMGELIPSAAFPIIRKALNEGSVLFLVPKKGYGNSVLCNKCRNLALCTCGGRLELTGALESPRCVLCRASYEGWKCRWCQSGEIYLASRGIDRFAEEIGRSFPNYPVINSSGEHIVDSSPDFPSLVIATPGAQPKTYEGYASVALLEGLRFFGHSELRSTESSREVFFQSAAMANSTGPIFLSLMPTHPIVAALTRWDASPIVRKELREREEMDFPPYFRFIYIDIETQDAVKFSRGMVTAQKDGRLDVHVLISGPHVRSKDVSRIILSAPVARASAVVDFVHELQRRRSVSSKPLFTIRVDPYSLT